jgi:hypothetical protein
VRDWCTKRGMQMSTLKTLSQMEAVSKELMNLIGKNRTKIESDLRLKLKLFALLQMLILSGCLLRTLAGSRMDSSSGRTARQWTNPLGTVNNQIMHAQAKRLASG